MSQDKWVSIMMAECMMALVVTRGDFPSFFLTLSSSGPPHDTSMRPMWSVQFVALMASLMLTLPLLAAITRLMAVPPAQVRGRLRRVRPVTPREVINTIGSTNSALRQLDHRSRRGVRRQTPGHARVHSLISQGLRPVTRCSIGTRHWQSRRQCAVGPGAWPVSWLSACMRAE